MLSLSVQLILGFCGFAIGIANDAPDLSISRMASDLLAAEQQAIAAYPLKEWTIDWQSDLEDVRTSLLNAGPSINAKNLLEDILVDDGHDELSDDGFQSYEWTMRDTMGRCGCCSMMNFKNSVPSASNLQPQLFNGLVQTVCDRIVADIKMSGCEPMPLLLRRRSVRETAFLFQSRLHFKRSIRTTNGSIEEQRNGKSHDALESNQWDMPPVRVLASLAGLSSLRRSGDVQTVVLPNGRTMLKVNMVAGPLKLSVPYGDVTAVSQPPSELNLSPTQSSGEVTVVDEVPAEMNLMLHPRQGLILHSFRFAKPSKFSSDPAPVFVPPPRIPFRASAIPVANSANEAAVAQHLRRAIRQTLRRS